MAKPSEIFWTYPAESESGKTLIVTGRDDVDAFRQSGKYPFRINITWDYEADAKGMPASEETMALMEQATDGLMEETQRDPAAVLTGIYTGDGRRDWVLYTRSLHIFRNILNRAWADLPDLPVEIDATEDPDWDEYTDMRANTYISDQ